MSTTEKIVWIGVVIIIVVTLIWAFRASRKEAPVLPPATFLVSEEPESVIVDELQDFFYDKGK